MWAIDGTSRRATDRRARGAVGCGGSSSSSLLLGMEAYRVSTEAGPSRCSVTENAITFGASHPRRLGTPAEYPPDRCEMRLTAYRGRAECTAHPRMLGAGSSWQLACVVLNRSRLTNYPAALRCGGYWANRDSARASNRLAFSCHLSLLFLCQQHSATTAQTSRPVQMAMPPGQ